MNYVAKCSFCDAKVRVDFGLTLPPVVRLPQGWAIVILGVTPRGKAELSYHCPEHGRQIWDALSAVPHS
jgi:hypothetical protein